MNETTRTAHWDRVFTEKTPDAVSWYQPEPQPSLDLIRKYGAAIESRPLRVVDIGGGDSRLPDFLLDSPEYELTALDISARAIDRLRERLGDKSDRLRSVVSDVTQWRPEGSFHIWHDRASFHFLLEPAEIRQYAATTAKAVAPGGALIVGTFALDGPEKCSGLPVTRYSPESMAEVFAESFTLEESLMHLHGTPFGTTQSFVFCVFRREG